MNKTIEILLVAGVCFGLGFGIAKMDHGDHTSEHLSDNTSMSHDMHSMNHDPMQMSMADMGARLEGQTGDALDKAFLEGMIPHHQGAIDMAKYLVNAKHPELQQMGEEIIAAQQAEIDQMNEWLLEWGYITK